MELPWMIDDSVPFPVESEMAEVEFVSRWYHDHVSLKIGEYRV